MDDLTSSEKLSNAVDIFTLYLDLAVGGLREDQAPDVEDAITYIVEAAAERALEMLRIVGKPDRQEEAGLALTLEQQLKELEVLYHFDLYSFRDAEDHTKVLYDLTLTKWRGHEVVFKDTGDDLLALVQRAYDQVERPLRCDTCDAAVLTADRPCPSCGNEKFYRIEVDIPVV